jgi:hypothetical protein
MKLIRVKCKDAQFLVEDINVGKEINKLFDQFNKIKTQKEFDSWSTTIKNWRSGTYGTKNLLDLLEGDFPVKNSSPAGREFVIAIRKILK